jgi:uncharacterized membrane protein YkvI
MTSAPTWALAIVGAFALAAVHALTPLMEASSRRHQALVASVVGGMGLSYVFVYLLFRLAKYGAPEIHRLLPIGPDALETMFVVLLTAVATAYLLQIQLLRRPGCAMNHAGTATYWTLYNVVAGAALVEEAQRGWVRLALYAIAIGCHIGINDWFLLHLCPERHRGIWRLGLTAAPLVGCLIVLGLEVPAGALYLLLTLVAGFTVITTIRLELPGPADFQAAGFLGGLLFYALLILATWQR